MRNPFHSPTTEAPSSMKRAIFTLAAALSLMLPHALPAEPAAAQDETPPWYEFEILVFERINKGAGSTELWPDDPGTPPLLNVIPFDTRGKETLRDNSPIPYRPLPAEERKLGAIWSKLRGSRNYRPLYHVAWRQQVVDPDEAQALYLYLPPENGAEAGPENPPRLEGTLKIGVKRYLHLETDLLLHRPRRVDETGDQADPYALRPAFEAYRLQTNQRLRSGKLHLLDHPILGVLVQAEKYEPPKPDPLAEPASVTDGATGSAAEAPAQETAPAEADPAQR